MELYAYFFQINFKWMIVRSEFDSLLVRLSYKKNENVKRNQISKKEKFSIQLFV